MTIIEKIKQRILSFLGLEHLADNPNSPKYTFINNEDVIIRQKISEYKVWYIGDSDELQNYYTNRDLSGNAKEPIYNRNKYNYFWGIAVKEFPVKKVHSGVPKAMIDTLSSIVGMPQITSGDDETNYKIQKILKANQFTNKLTQEARPLTLAIGWGGWKPIINAEKSKHPIIEFYEAEDVDYIYSSGILIGMVFKDYYKYKNKDYLLLETRRVQENDSIIEYELFRLGKSNDLTPVSLDTIPELASLPEQGIKIEGLKKVLGVPSKYFYDPSNKNYGASIYAGKVDVFDDMDQCLTQASQTEKVSTPVEYLPVNMLERGRNGETVLPNVYNRQYIKLDTLPNGDGEGNNRITTTQPSLNFGQYIERFNALLDIALIGKLSPSSLGFNVAKKDNADAQREKEKATIFTRNSICDSEGCQIAELVEQCLILDEYIEKGSISKTNYDISVKYEEFANPSFETLSQVLTPMYNSGALSTEMFVDKLYGDSLSDEERAKEIERLEKIKQQDNIDLEEYGINPYGNEKSVE